MLLLARHIRHERRMTGLAVALRASALTADAVAQEARKAAEGDGPVPTHATAPASPAPVRPATGEPARATVTFLAEWRLSHLPPDTRPLPSVPPYDQLLRRRGPRASGEGEAP